MPISVADTEDGAQADSRGAARRVQRSRQQVWQLAAGEPADGSGAEVHGLGLPLLVGGGIPRQHSCRGDVAGDVEVVVGGALGRGLFFVFL